MPFPGAVGVVCHECWEQFAPAYQLSPLNFAVKRKLTDQEDIVLSAITHRLITRAIDRRPRTLLAANR